MKAINLKEIMKSYDRVAKAESNIRFYRDAMRGSALESSKEHFKKGLVTATETHTAARLEFNTISGKLQDAVDEAQERSRERTITAFDIAKALYQYTERLDIPKKYMDGVEVQINVNAQDFPKAYKYTPMATWFAAEFKGGSWRVIAIYRGTCTNSKGTAYLPESAKDAIISNYTKVR